ncbi:hypothetical protein Ancab_022030 [Ancistrocladus abbreviatus]
MAILYRPPFTTSILQSDFRIHQLQGPDGNGNSSTSPRGPGPGESESRIILDAFFLGRAFGEVLSERIESTVGEFLSTIGRLQAEQQKQVQEFQEDVLDRAKRAKEKAAREAMEGPGRIPNSTAADTSSVTDGTSLGSTLPGSGAATPGASSSVANANGPTSVVDQDLADQDPLTGVSTDG